MGFIEDYVEYHATQCQAPHIFAKLESLFLIGSAMGRNFINPMNVKIRHNIYVFLVGPTSKFNKSSSMRVMMEFINKTDIPKLPLETSPESFISSLAETPQCVYVKDEFGNELSRIARKNSYMGGFIDVMSHLWGEYDHYSRKTQGGGLVEIEEPYLSCFLATTDDRFDTYARNDAVMSGWLPRHAISFPDDDDLRPFQGLFYEEDILDNSHIIGLRSNITDFMQGLRCIRGEVKMKFQDINYFNQNLKSIQEPSTVDNPVLLALYNKMGEYLAKFADILKISDMNIAMIAASNEIIVENDYIDKAMLLVNQITSKYPSVFENRIERDFNLAVRRIIDYIHKNQSKFDTLPLTRPEIVNASRVDSETFSIALQTLIESGKVYQLFIRNLVNARTHENMPCAKEVFILADYYTEFSNRIENDMIGLSLRVHQLRSGTAETVTSFSENSIFDRYI